MNREQRSYERALPEGTSHQLKQPKQQHHISYVNK
jgi:hypothetical protein